MLLIIQMHWYKDIYKFKIFDKNDEEEFSSSFFLIYYLLFYSTAFKMRANRSDNDFQFQLTAIFSDNGYQYQLKKF